jgi:hypothetical protein
MPSLKPYTLAVGLRITDYGDSALNPDLAPSGTRRELQVQHLQALDLIAQADGGPERYRSSRVCHRRST